jgi:hypothetical protein
MRWPWIAGVALAAAVAGCGSSSKSHSTISNVSITPTTSVGGGKTFSASGMALHFSYPANFRVVPLAQSSRTSGATTNSSHAAVGIGRLDLLVVTRFAGAEPVAVTADSVSKHKPNIDRLLSNVFSTPMSGTVTTVGGLPALSYTRVAAPGIAATTRVTVVFSGHDEYELQCQATQAKLAAIENACDQMNSTLSVK